MRFKITRPPLPDHLTLRSGDTNVQIRLRRDNRAQRYLLRIPADHSGPVLTVPKSGDAARAERFARQHIDWLLSRLREKPDQTPFQDGSIVPLRGTDHLIVATGRLRGLVSVANEGNSARILVPGAPEHLARKLTSYLKEEARKDLTQACAVHSEKIGRKVAGISIRDTTSRWGSCASNGRLSFSWRLILAPPEILDYVAAHEVAHLREMNHSDRFWKICRDLAPQTPAARKWLKEKGSALHTYG